MDLADFIDRNAAFTPDKPAIRAESTVLSYAELAQHIAMTAAAQQEPPDGPRVPRPRGTPKARTSPAVCLFSQHLIKIEYDAMGMVLRDLGFDGCDLAVMPGSRSIVLVSPGFYLTIDHRIDENDLMERAIRANVTINSLDARGLYIPGPEADASQHQPGTSGAGTISKSQYQRDSALANEDVMAELADATGGTFFHNNNDLREGLKRLAAQPDFIYVLGFSPQNLKFDGSFHQLKVTLKNPAGAGYTLQARRGYSAPRHAIDPEQQARDEIREAVYSREELHDIPVDLNLQFFKSSEVQAKLSVLARVDIRNLRYRKASDRNNDKLTIVSGVFDRNGNFISGLEKIVELRKANPGGGPHSLTGPIFVKGAKAGDVMEIRIRKIVPKRVGANFNLPGKEFPTIGALAPQFPEGYVRYFDIDPKRSTITFKPGIEVPLRPFPGTLAVGIDPNDPSPRKGGSKDPMAPVSTLRPWKNGSNMDINELTAGSTILIPVFLEGGLIWTGDSHCAQGNGEVNLTAIECSYESIEIQPIVRHDLPIPRF